MGFNLGLLLHISRLRDSFCDVVLFVSRFNFQGFRNVGLDLERLLGRLKRRGGSYDKILRVVCLRARTSAAWRGGAGLAGVAGTSFCWKVEVNW